jgi:hypothetical protein
MHVGKPLRRLPAVEDMLGARLVMRRAYRKDPGRQAAMSFVASTVERRAEEDTPRLGVGTYIAPLRSPCARFQAGSNCEPRGIRDSRGPTGSPGPPRANLVHICYQTAPNSSVR